jgi:ATP-dependent DNA helicase RecG
MKDVKAATVEHDRLAREVFPTLRLGLLHGKMKPADKQRVMEEFRNHDFDILVATSVVEVGIDVANATIIVIEAAERFGLAALHQLRGRVGRGQKQSYCLLFPTDQQSYPSQRLAYFTKHNLGIDIAQYDMKLRGVGDLYGTMQHGELSLKIANLGDYELIAQVQSAAKTYLQTNTVSDNKPLVERLKHEEVAQVAHD